MGSIDLETSKKIRRLTIEIQKVAIEYDRIQTCTNCHNWDKNRQKCKEFNMLPPAEVIVVGCEEWNYIIPF